MAEALSVNPEVYISVYENLFQMSTFNVFSGVFIDLF
jgi:hypothetical protein